ncbi:unnamed protein product, partial [Rotaria socialis]
VLDQHQPQISEHQQGRLPFEQLKRAVSSNLPCFLIEYDQDVNSKNRPSDISAASIKLKLGVNNKESYAALISTDKRPSEINNINITVMQPKFIPHTFALVVRYVSLQARCAQCNGDHQSLSSECDKVVEYRSELKAQVNNAISSGKLHRLIPQDRIQSMEFQTKKNEFPSLPQCMSGAAPWKLASAQQATTTNMNGSEAVTKILVSMNQNILDMKENTHRIHEKLDRINDKVNQSALETELHQETLEKLLPICVSIVCDFIWPVMAHNIAGLGDQHSQLQKLLSNADLLLRDLKSDY